MKKFQIALAILSGFIFKQECQAQVISPSTVSSAGNYSNAGGILLEQDIGGLSVATIGTPGFMFTQGFLQPDAGTTTTTPYINDVTLSSSGNGIDNAGTTFINGNIMLEFTTGELASITHINGNNMLTQGILQPYNTGVVLPVTGFDLLAKRKDAYTVLLHWKTVQEFNNKGFHIERKKENENSFTTIGYMATAAPGGNSSLPLSYQHTDNNAFTGKTYYRIRQEDIDGSIAYSPVRMVDGIGNTNRATLKVWPIPSTGPVNVVADGLSKAGSLQVFDMNGRLVQQHTLQNNISIQLIGLSSGTYMLQLAGHKELLKKIVLQ